MKKRNLFTLILVALLAVSIGIGGTIAYYSKVFTSNDNLIRTTKFEVDSDGTLNKDVEFDLTDKPLSPGVEMDIYEFKVNKNNTETNVKYNVSVLGLDEIFQDVGENQSPIELKLFRQVGEEWTEQDLETEILDPSDFEKFKVGVKWEHQDEYDIDYQGKNGKVNIKVVATQVDEVEEPEPEPEPDPDSDDVAEAKAYLIGLGNDGLGNKAPTQLTYAHIRIPSSYNQKADFKFSDEFEYGTEERTNGRISVRSTDSNTGYPFELEAIRDENNGYTVKVKLVIIKGDARDTLTYEISVPKAGKRKDPFTGTPTIPAEPVTVRLLP